MSGERESAHLRAASRARDLGDWREASDQYLAAARAATGEQADQHTLRAAECLTHAGALGPAWRLLRALLEQHGVQVPSSATQALVGSTWRRGRFVLRRPDLDAEGPASPADERRRLVLEGAAELLGPVHTALADALRTHHLAEAARSGDPSARCRAIASEVAMQTRIGGPFDKTVKKLLERCAELAGETGEPRDEAWRLLAVATHEFAHGRWRACVDACEAADAIFVELADEGVAVGSERTRIAAIHWFALAWLGELPRLQTILERAQAQAEADKDSLTLLEVLTGQPFLVWLAHAEGEAARTRARQLLRHHEAVPGAPWPESGYRRQHYRDLVAEVHARLFAGDPLPAWIALTRHWRELESTFYLPMRTIGIELRSARGRAALAVVEQLDRAPERTQALLDEGGFAGWGGWDRERLLADVDTQIEQISKESSCVAAPLANLLAAGLANLRRRGDEAQVRLDAAVRGFDAVGMALHRECARLALGEVIAGHEGGQLQDRADAWLREVGVADTRRFAGSQAPGFSLCLPGTNR